MESVADWPLERKLQEALSRSLPKLGPGVREQVSALLTKETLGVMAAVLTAWVVSHAFGVGEAIDLIILAAGAIAIGMAVFEGLDQLYHFARRTYGARSTDDLDAAAGHFARAVAILGIQAVLAVLLRGAPRSYKGGTRAYGPVTPVGQAYKPTLRWSKVGTNGKKLPAGAGGTDSWGDIVVSSRGSSTTRQLVMLHERIHQILTPKLYRLRNFRIANRDASYVYSSLSRLLEEALAETYAQAKVHGALEALSAIRFPIQQRYVYLFRRGGYKPNLEGMGVVPELLGIAVGSVSVQSIIFDVFVGPGAAEPATSDEIPPPSVGHGASGSW
jgi:hypothetical protein